MNAVFTSGVEKLLHGNITSARSVKEMNITSLALPHGLYIFELDLNVGMHV